MHYQSLATTSAIRCVVVPNGHSGKQSKKQAVSAIESGCECQIVGF